MIAVALDAILVVVVVEAAVLGLYRARTGRGITPRALLPNLAAGFCLVLVARLTLDGGGWMAVGAALSAALLAHVVDLAGRWRA